MAVSLAEIREWFDSGQTNKMAYMIVVCDTYDHEDYPVYAKDAAECLVKYDAHNGPNMQRIMEVYDLSKTWQQSPAKRVWELPARPEVEPIKTKKAGFKIIGKK